MRIVTGIGILSVAVFGSVVSSQAEERLKDYIYNPDGSFYEKSLTSRSQLRGSGYVEASGGASYAQSTEDYVNRFGLRGSYGRVISANWHLQTDIDYEYASTDTASGDRFFGTLHLATRFPNDFALGAFGQFGMSGANGVTQHGFGVEGASYSERSTVYGRVGYAGLSYSGNTGGELFATLGARGYFHDNAALEAEANVSQDFGSARATALIRRPNTNATFSLTARYDATLDDNLDQGVITGLAAVRYSFGSNSLKQEEREGVIWQPVR